MKKILCVFIIFLMLLPMTVMAWTIPGIPVPYEIDFDFAVGNEYYRIETLTELYRLLELAKEMRKMTVSIVPAGVSTNEITRVVMEFGEKNKELIFDEKPYPDIPGFPVVEFQPYSVTHSDITSSIKFYWRTYVPNTYETLWPKYKAVPVIDSVEQLCDEAEKCGADIYYDKVFCISEKLLTPEEYSESRISTLIDEVKQYGGTDISDFISDHFCDKNTTPNTILIRLQATTKAERDEMADQERYERILINNTICPITDDMSEADRLRVVLASVSNIYQSYLETNTFLNNTKQKEYSYSEGLGQCYHYAKMTQMLCERFGIECIYVHGTLRGTDHGWNIIKYDGNWYMIDRTGDRVKGYDPTPEMLQLALFNEEHFLEGDYVWDIDAYPRCTSPEIILEEDFSAWKELSETTHKISMFEPYRISDPMGGGATIHYDIWFDTETCAIVAIDSNLSSDGFAYENGEWKVKDTVLRFPAEVTVEGKTYKVKTIGPHIDRFSRIGSYDHIYIPDDVVVTDFAYGVMEVRPLASTLHIGDNVTIGYGSMPSTHGKAETGENFVYKGGFPHANYASMSELSLGDGTATVNWGKTENLVVPEGTKYVNYFVGNNILDREPTKTLEIPSGTYFVDPRLNRLNRKFIVSENNQHYKAVDGVLYSKDMTKLVSVPVGVKSIEIPESVTEIGEYAFGYCNEIEEIIIPASVKTIGNNAFWHLSNVKTIYFEGEIPESYKPYLCGNVKTVCLADAHSSRIDYKIENGRNMHITGVPAGGRAITVFYGVGDAIMEIESGTEIQIPALTRKFEIFVWDEKMKPYDIKKTAEL